MHIWELNTEESGLTSFYLPKKDEKEKYIQMIDQALDTSSPLSHSWEALILLKKNRKSPPPASFSSC